MMMMMDTGFSTLFVRHWCCFKCSLFIHLIWPVCVCACEFSVKMSYQSLCVLSQIAYINIVASCIRTVIVQKVNNFCEESWIGSTVLIGIELYFNGRITTAGGAVLFHCCCCCVYASVHYCWSMALFKLAFFYFFKKKRTEKNHWFWIHLVELETNYKLCKIIRTW